jgi:uncharacterized protein
MTKTAKCPLCKNPSTPESRPFCSEGCRNRDLLKWLDDGYAIPGPAAPDPEHSSGSDFDD